MNENFLEDVRAALMKTVDEVIGRVRFCPLCREPFLKQHAQKYCSRRCAEYRKVKDYRARQRALQGPLKTPRQCATCGTRFRSSAYQARYCSARCRHTMNKRVYRQRAA